MSWIAIASTVASLAANILASLNQPAGAEGAERATPYTLGNILWTPRAGPDSLEVLATNMGIVEEGLCYTVTSPSSNLSVYQALPEATYYNATDDLMEFSNGQVTVGRVMPAEGAGVGRAVSFSVRLLALGTFIKVVGGINIKVDSHEFTIQSTSPPGTTWPWHLKVTGTDGRSVELKGAVPPSGGGAEARPTGEGGLEWSWHFPPGFVLDQLVTELDLQMELDSEFYEDATRERRARLRPSRPPSA